MLNVQTHTQAIYETFGKGDIRSIINALADDVQWEQWENNSAQEAGVPWMKGGTGKQAAMDYFNEVGQFTFKDFRVLAMTTSSHQAAVEYAINFEIPALDI